MTDDVTAEVVLEGACSGPNRRTLLLFAWSRRDPLAVRVVLSPRPDHPALPRGRWAVLRDLLRDGCDHAAGGGDVRVRPEPGGAVVALDLCRDGRMHTARVPAAVVRDFLAATERIVPAGTERADAAIDVLIARLLRTGS